MKNKKKLTTIFLCMVLSFCFSNMIAQSYVDIDYISKETGTVVAEVYQGSKVIATKTTVITRTGTTPISLSLPQNGIPYTSCTIKVTYQSTGASASYNLFGLPGYIVALINSKNKVIIEDAAFYYSAGGGNTGGGGGGPELPGTIQ